MDFATQSATVPSTYNSASSFATIQPPPGPGLGWSGAGLTTSGQIKIVVMSSPVVAGFTRTPTSGVFPLAVTFDDASTGATYWVWNFGDGTMLLTTSAASPRHTYTSAGTFTVIQTAYGPGGVSSVTNTASVIVAYPPPVAMFTTSPTNGFAPLFSKSNQGHLDGGHHQLVVESGRWDDGDQQFEHERGTQLCDAGHLHGEPDRDQGEGEHQHADE